MDDLVNRLIQDLQGKQPFKGWTGFNYPSDIQKKSNLWVTKAGARIFQKGFSHDPQVDQRFAEWGVVVDGQLDILWEGKKLSATKGMFYAVSDAATIVADAIGEPFLVWMEFTGDLSAEFLEMIGGRRGGVSVGRAAIEQVKNLFNIAYLLQNHPPGYNIKTQSLLWKFLSESNYNAAKERKFSADIKRALDYIHTMPAAEKVTVSKLASISMLSVETFRKKFQSEIGEAPIQYLLRYRISNAKNLLMDATKPIKQVAIESGFADPYYFSRLFKHHEGICPLHYRKKMFQLTPAL